MKWFYDLKIANKLFISFTAVLALTSLLGVFSITQLTEVSQASTDIAADWLPGTSNALKMKVTLARYRLSELQHILADDDEILADEAKSLGVRQIELQKYHEAYARSITGSDEKALSQEFDKTLAAYVAEDKKVVELSRAKKKDEARELIRAESTLLYRKLNAQIDQMVKFNEEGGTKSNETAIATYAAARIWIVAMLFGSVVIGLLLAWWVARIVSRPLKQAVDIARRVAEGDLTAHIEDAGKDETGQLINELKVMNSSLQTIVGEVRASTGTIAIAAAEIATGNLDLSSRTEEQAGSLEETASAMEELTSTVKQNADNARQADQLAASASEIAVQGGSVVGQVIDTMGSIDASSKKIVDIISVIDGIAFQTNILALNAAVEAARAGEQGRGFAVVASEVRSLAQRSAAAAKEIKTLIDDSVEKVGAGSKLVEQAGVTMNEVVASVKRVTDIVGEISSSSQEQSLGIEQINRAISQMDNVTQQNAALVEQAAAAAQSMQDQADNLAQAVGIFKLGDAQAIPVARFRNTIDVTPQRPRLNEKGAA